MFNCKAHTDKTRQHLFTRCLGAMMLAAFMFGTWVAPAYGQLPEPSVRVDWIHPGPVPAGSDIPLYAMVHNQGEGDIQVLSFRTQYSRNMNYPYNEHYQFRPCRQSCSLFTTVEAGQSLIMAAGILYPSEEIIHRVPVIQNNNSMTYFDENGEPALLRLPVIDIRTVPNNLVDEPNPALFPVPDRHPLETRDLHEPDDALLIHDPNTNLDWLRLDVTQNMNLDELTAALSSSGRFSGFEVARVSQIETLMLNHIHADGIAAQRHELHFWPSAATRPAIADFIRMIQPIQDDESYVILSGMVADKPLTLSFENPDIFAGLLINVSTPPVNPERPVSSAGAQVFRLPQDNLGTEGSTDSIWLVRGADLLEHSAVQATFIDNELWIPSVQLGDEYFSAVLRLIDPELLVLVVAELISIDATSPSAYFDPETEFIVIPDAIIYEEGHPPVAVNVALQLIPDTNPPALQVIGIEAR